MGVLRQLCVPEFGSAAVRVPGLAVGIVPPQLPEMRQAAADDLPAVRTLRGHYSGPLR